LGTGNNSKFLHTPSFDYNDEMIGYGAWIWAKFVEDKFGAKDII
jgi:metal-dependent amidase/aminoacylase/carboxypeptidase family protein